MNPVELTFPAAGYLCGAIPFGVFVARARGVDPFKAGSGNIGATNIGRLIGKKFGILVFVCDFLKGLLPTAFALWITGPGWLAISTGVAAMLGHMYSPFLGFRGGKGVATGTGAVAVLLPTPFLFALLAFASAILASCTMSLASIVAAMVLAGSQLSLSATFASSTTLFAFIVLILVISRHHANISRLRAGTESQLQSLTRIWWIMPGLHTLALGLWVGSVIFFSFIATPSIFDSFRRLATDRPNWLVVVNEANIGHRLAGMAVGPMFVQYFQLQAICGIIATGSAVGFIVMNRQRLSIWRAALLCMALVAVATSWPIVQKVGHLRALSESDELARSLFGMWHGISMALNLLIALLVTPALAMAAYVRRGAET